jgi:hypothetical protein
VSLSPSSVSLAKLASVSWRFLIFCLRNHLFFVGGLSFEPFMLWVASFFYRMSFFWASCFLRLPLFLSKVFLLSPLHFRGCLLFHQRSFFWTLHALELPLFSSEVFLASFFYRRSFFWAPSVLGLPLFSPEVFLLSPLHFGVTSFFIGGLSFEPMNKDCNDAPSFVALAYLA